MISSVFETGKVEFRRLFQLKRALQFVWQSARLWTVVNALLIVIQGTLPLLPLYLTKLMIDTATAAVGKPLKEEALETLLWIIALMGAVSLFGSLIRAMVDQVGERQAENTTDRMSDLIHAKSIELDLAYYGNPKYHDTLHRAQREAPFRPSSIVNGLLQAGQNAVLVLAMGGLLCSFHWIIAMILFAGVVPTIVVRLRYARKIYRWHRERTSVERQTNYANQVITGSEYAKEIRAFGLGDLFATRFRDLRQSQRSDRHRLTIERSIAGLAAQACATVTIYGSCMFVAFQTLNGTGTLGDLVMYVQVFQRMQSSLQGLFATMSGLYEDNLFLSNLYEFLDLKPMIIEPLQDNPVPSPIKSGIELAGVNFLYPGSSRKVLTDVSLMIKPGETVAVVGENGSGKTTLVKLLCRFYDPTEGAITLDGMDLRQFRTATLRREISVIFQDYARFQLSARENIWLGNIAIPRDDERIRTAARGSGADGFITPLPHGYETILGKWFEDGEELSIGEWQKLALARSFMRDAQITILDEPTSALDAKAEDEIFRRFHEYASGRMTLLISHRFSTIQMADRIYVMKEGRIIESGSHLELLDHQGAYAGLFEAQAKHYR